MRLAPGRQLQTAAEQQRLERALVGAANVAQRTEIQSAQVVRRARAQAFNEVDVAGQGLVLAHRKQCAVRDFNAAPVGVVTAVLDLEPGVLGSGLIAVNESRAGLDQLGGQFVGADLERQGRGGAFFFTVPVVTQDHPGALAAAKHHPPAVTLAHRSGVGPVVAGCWCPGPEFVGAGPVDQQRPRPGGGEALGAAEPRAGRIVHQQAVVHTGELQLLRGQGGVHGG